MELYLTAQHMIDFSPVNLVDFSPCCVSPNRPSRLSGCDING